MTSISSRKHGRTATGYQFRDGLYQPTEAFVHLFVQSDFDGSTAQAEHGDDKNDGMAHGAGLTNIKPFRSFRGLRQSVEGVEDGFTIVCHPMGADGIGGPDDFENPTAERWYQIRQFDFGGHEACRNNFVLAGPRSMLPLVQGLVITGGHTDGLRTRLDFAGGGVSNAQFRSLRMTRDDGREIFFPIPISEDGAADGHPGSIYVECGLTLADFLAAQADPRGCHISVVNSAAVILPEDGVYSGVHFTGTGCQRFGDRNFTNSYDANLYDLMERVHVPRSYFTNVTGSLANVQLDDQHRTIGGSLTYRNCTAVQVVNCQSDARPLSAHSQYTTRLEPMGRMLSYTLPLDTHSGDTSMNPESPLNGVDLCCTSSTGGCHLALGEDLGLRSGNLIIYHGLSVIYAGGGQDLISISGPNSGLLMFGFDAFLYMRASDPAQLGIWAKGGGWAGINDSQGRIQIDGTTHQLRVGTETDIELGAGAGQFRDPGGANGNFTSAFDGSRIWDTHMASLAAPGYYGGI